MLMSVYCVAVNMRLKIDLSMFCSCVVHKEQNLTKVTMQLAAASIGFC